MSQTRDFVVEKPARLDAFLTQALGESRNQIAGLVKQGYVTVEGKCVQKPGLKLKGGESLHVTLPRVEPERAKSVDFDVSVLYEDEDILVIDKPNALTVHPAPSVKEATLVDWLKHKGVSLSTISGEERHGIVHRLDKGTTGVMVVAKNNAAHEKLSVQLQDKSMGRYYLAVVTPPLKELVTVVESKIGRSHTNRLKMANVEHGKEAKSSFRILLNDDAERTQLVACKLFSGRTHQIRVHLEKLGRHILGDHLYGIKSKNAKIQTIMLHAYILYLKHPRSGEMMEFSAPLPEHMREYLRHHFTKESFDAVIDTGTFNSYFH